MAYHLLSQKIPPAGKSIHDAVTPYFFSATITSGKRITNNLTQLICY